MPILGVFTVFVNVRVAKPNKQSERKLTLICVPTRVLFAEFQAACKHLKLAARNLTNRQQKYKITLTPRLALTGRFEL